jgi:DNA-binding GntR family transcriptional regulator
MEALRRLSADGMVEIVPQVGSLVAIHEPREADDFYLMFSGFEGAIAGIAAQRRTDIQLAELDLISLRIDALRSQRDAAVRSRSYRELNRPFHHAIHHMAHSWIMAETSRRMWTCPTF